MSFSETIFLFVLALVVFGPKKLPEIARQIGKALNEFRRASNEFKAQIEHEISNLEVESKKQAALPSSSAPEGTASRTLSAESSGTAETQASTSESTPAEASPVPATLAASAEEPAQRVVEPATEALPSTENSQSELAATDHSVADHSVARSSVNSPVPDHSAHSTSDLHDSESVTTSTTQESHA